jgi:hypothetical protein
MMGRHKNILLQERILSLMICRTEKDALKRLQAGSRHGLHPSLAALLPALIDRRMEKYRAPKVKKSKTTRAKREDEMI